MHVACKAEVTQLQNAVVRHQNVCWLDIPVENLHAEVFGVGGTQNMTSNMMKV